MASLADWTPLITGALGALSVGGISRFTIGSRLAARIKSSTEFLEKLASIEKVEIDASTAADLKSHIAGLTRQLISESSDSARAEYYLRVMFAWFFICGIYPITASIFPALSDPILENTVAQIVFLLLLFGGGLGFGITVGRSNRRLQNAMDNK